MLSYGFDRSREYDDDTVKTTIETKYISGKMNYIYHYLENISQNKKQKQM